MRMAAVVADHLILTPEDGTDTDRHRLLSDTEMDGTAHPLLGITLDDRILDHFSET